MYLQGNEYYREGGCWGVGFKEIDGKLYSTSHTHENLNNQRLYKATSEEYHNDNLGYSNPKHKIKTKYVWFLNVTKDGVEEPRRVQILGGSSSNLKLYLFENTIFRLDFSIGKNFIEEDFYDLTLEYYKKYIFFRKRKDCRTHFEELLKTKKINPTTLIKI